MFFWKIDGGKKRIFGCLKVKQLIPLLPGLQTQLAFLCCPSPVCPRGGAMGMVAVALLYRATSPKLLI